MNDSYLCHYGVLGMKWGVRKDKIKDTAGQSYKKAKKVASKGYNKSKDAYRSKSDEYKEYRKERKEYLSKNKATKKNLYSDLSTLSNEEMRKRINRMRLEQEYSQIVKNQNYNITRNKGRSFVTSFVKNFVNMSPIDKEWDRTQKAKAYAVKSVARSVL